MAKPKEAMVDFNDYLNSPYIEKSHQAWGHFRIGQSYYQLKQYAKAEEHYTKSVKIDGHKGAKIRIARMRKMRKEGKLSY